MEKKIINIYKFEELKKEIQEKVLKIFRDNEDYYFLEETMKDELKEELKIKKIKEIGETLLNYSLNNCQGDGLSFTGLFQHQNYIIKIERGNSNYYHKNSVDFDIEYINQDENEVYPLPTEEERIKEIFFNIMDTLEKYGYSYIDECISDEQIKNNINEYTFRSNGEIEAK